MDIPFGEQIPGRLCPPNPQRTLKTDQTLAYQFYEDRQKPNLLLIHGNGGSVCTFADLIPCLKQDFCLTVPDLPFHGNSPSRNREFFSDPFVSADYCFNVMDHAGVNSFYLAGHSLGGMIGLMMALGQEKERIQGLILLDSFVRYGERVPPILLSMEAFDGDPLINQKIADAMDDGTETEWYHNFDVSSHIHALICPVLELIGEASSNSQEAFASFMAANRDSFPASYVVKRLTKCGHFMLIERPKAVAEEIKRAVFQWECGIEKGTAV